MDRDIDPQDSYSQQAYLPGYAQGRWPTYSKRKRGFPTSKRVSFLANPANYYFPRDFDGPPGPPSLPGFFSPPDLLGRFSPAVRPVDYPELTSAHLAHHEHLTAVFSLHSATNITILPSSPTLTAPLPTTEMTDRDAAIVRMNNDSCARTIPSFSSILTKASHATLYAYNNNAVPGPNLGPDSIHPSQAPEWRDTSISGPLFIVTLTSADHIPRFALIIKNRNGLQNFAIEIVDPEGVEIPPSASSTTDPNIHPSSDQNANAGFIIIQHQPFPVDLPQQHLSNLYGPSLEPKQEMWGLHIFAAPGSSTQNEQSSVAETLRGCVRKIEVARERHSRFVDEMAREDARRRVGDFVDSQKLAREWGGVEFDYSGARPI